MPVGAKENDETADAAITLATRNWPKVVCILKITFSEKADRQLMSDDSQIEEKVRTKKQSKKR